MPRDVPKKRLLDDHAEVRRPSGLPGVELLRARYRRQHFARHFHRRYAIGTITNGAMAFRFLGRDHLAEAGAVNLTTPGEVHDGHAGADRGWAYSMFYLDPDLVRSVADQFAGQSPHARSAEDLPQFATGVLRDPELARLVADTHDLLWNPAAPALTAQTRLLSMIALWLRRHSVDRPRLAAPGAEPRAVNLARQYMEAHLDRDVTLDDLSRAAKLSPFHLARTFHKATGLPPHAWLLQARVRRARQLMGTSMRLADIALETGFTDQSHLTHAFRRQVGITPGRYRKYLQDSAISPK